MGSKSVGISGGRRGLRFSTNSRTGSQINAGIPGTGISYRHHLGRRGRKAAGGGQGAPSQSGQMQSGQGWAWGCLPLWALVSPGSCGCAGVIGLVLGVALINMVIDVLVLAVQLFFALCLGLWPLLLALVVLVLAIRFCEPPARKHSATFAVIVAAGIVANTLYLLLVPSQAPLAAMARLQQPRLSTASRHAGTGDVGAGESVEGKTAAVDAALQRTSPQTPAQTDDSGPQNPDRRVGRGGRGAVTRVELKVVSSEYELLPASGSRFSSRLYDGEREVAVTPSMRTGLREVRWRIRLHNVTCTR